MDMRIIHANSTFVELRYINTPIEFDAQIKAEGTLEENSYSLTIDVEDWIKEPVQIGHYIYIAGTEWGGPVAMVQHSTQSNTVVLEGPLWRGLLMMRVVEPPPGESHFVVPNMDANHAIREIVGGAFSNMLGFEQDEAGVMVEGQFRYTTMLQAIDQLLNDSDLRLNVTFDVFRKRAIIGARRTIDLSNSIELSQDYGIHMTSTLGRLENYNRIIALGQGELTEQMVVNVYLLPNGEASLERPGNWDISNERAIIFDGSNVETEEELVQGAIGQMDVYAQTETVEIDTREAELTLLLGDRVGVRDRITGLVAVRPVAEMILKIAGASVSIETKVG